MATHALAVATMSDPIHYVAWGKKGLFFECYKQALRTARREGVATPPAQPGWEPWLKVRKVPKTTSVDKVTCLACLHSLRALLKCKYPTEE